MRKVCAAVGGMLSRLTATLPASAAVSETSDLVRCSGCRIDVDGKDAGAGLHELVAEHGRFDGAATTRSNDTVIGDDAGFDAGARC